MNLLEIYNTLFAGNKLKMFFETSGELEKFRIRLHQVKKQQEQPQVDLGMMLEIDRQKLSFKPQPHNIDNRLLVLIMLEGKPAKIDYHVEIVDEDEDGSNGTSTEA